MSAPRGLLGTSGSPVSAQVLTFHLPRRSTSTKAVLRGPERPHGRRGPEMQGPQALTPRPRGASAGLAAR